tara:strand:+ start:118439 stop:118750 length:312 start_codon:yes stop_codon:yes gene_type:complete
MTQLDLAIMGQTYKLACKEGEEDALRDAVSYLDEKMCAIRDSGKIKGTDRIAVMAALSVTAELLSTRAPAGPFSDMAMSEVKQKIATMHTVLDAALAPQEKLF